MINIQVIFDWSAKKTAQNKNESSLSLMKCKNKLFVNKMHGSLFYEYCMSVLLHVVILYISMCTDNKLTKHHSFVSEFIS